MSSTFFKNWKIGTKLGAGFGLLVLILAALAYQGWGSVSKVIHVAEVLDQAGQPGSVDGQTSTYCAPRSQSS